MCLSGLFLACKLHSMFDALCVSECSNLANLQVAGNLPAKLRLMDKLITLNMDGNKYVAQSLQHSLPCPSTFAPVLLMRNLCPCSLWHAHSCIYCHLG